MIPPDHVIFLSNSSNSTVSFLNSSSHFHFQNDSAFTAFFTIFNPYSIVYTNDPSEFGVTVGLLKFILQGLFITVLLVFGVIGNVLAIVVLSSSHMNATSTSVFLRCLAVSDTLTILSLWLLVGMPTLLAFNPDGGKDFNSTWLVYNKSIVLYSKIIPSTLLLFFAVMGLTGNVFFTMALTMDRYLAVCKPFLVIKHDWGSWRKARNASVILFTCNILYNLPRFWEHEYFPIQTDFDNLTAYVPVPTSLRTNFYYDALYTHMSYVLGLFLLPLIYLIIFNIIIYRKIRRSNKFRRSLSHGAASSSTKLPDISLSYMLFGIVIVFMICQIIPASHASYRYIVGDIGTSSYVPEVEFLLCSFGGLNSSVNFVIYYASGTKFRNALKSVCGIFGDPKPQHNEDSTSQDICPNWIE